MTNNKCFFSLARLTLFLTIPGWAHSLAQTAPSAPSTHLVDPQIVAHGEAIFAESCSVGYCHGKAGRPGRGPRLRGKTWDKDYLFNVIWEGVPNSSMPAWKNKLSESEIWSVVAYIMTLSQLTSDSADLSTAASLAAPTKSAPVTSDKERELPALAAEKPSSGSGSLGTHSLVGDPLNGKALFFDSSNDLNCGTCHKIQGVGNEVGPNLSQIKQKPARDLFKDILLPSAEVASSRRLLKITTKAGEEIEAIKVNENDLQIKIYDVGSLPPVLRTISKEQVEKQEIQNRSAMPDTYGQIYTLKQLLDLIAFLKTGESAVPVSVTLNDLF